MRFHWICSESLCFYLHKSAYPGITSPLAVTALVALNPLCLFDPMKQFAFPLLLLLLFVHSANSQAIWFCRSLKAHILHLAFFWFLRWFQSAHTRPFFGDSFAITTMIHYTYSSSIYLIAGLSCDLRHWPLERTHAEHKNSNELRYNFSVHSWISLCKIWEGINEIEKECSSSSFCFLFLFELDLTRTSDGREK